MSARGDFTNVVNPSESGDTMDLNSEDDKRYYNIPICLGTLFFIILFTFFVYIICSESTEPKEERDDLINPFWIEDRDLGRGEVDHLSGVEIQFWKDLIDKYLSPIDADKKREVRYSKSYFFTYLF